MDMDTSLAICVPHTEEEKANLEALSDYLSEIPVFN